MSSFTFENLPDEILMMIFQYSGDTLTKLKTYLGLNQRLNNILLDKRLHLLTDYFSMNNQDDYSNCDLFQQVTKQLLCVNRQINDEELNQFFEPLISFYIQQKYIDSEKEIHLTIEKFRLIRQQFSDDELNQVDLQLRVQFENLRDITQISATIRCIKTLILKKGARLVCNDNELEGFNLAHAINQRFLTHINDINYQNSVSMNSLLSLFKILIISNPYLLNNRDYVGNGGTNIFFFLGYTLFRLNSFYNSYSILPINMECYRALIHLYLFVLQVSKQITNNNDYISDIFYFLSNIHNDLFIRTTQFEILKILIDKYAIEINQPWDDSSAHIFHRGLKQLVKTRRIDLIRYIHNHIQFEQLFQNPDYLREWVNTMLRNQLEKRFFLTKIDDRSLDFLISNKHLLFILLDKKQRKFLEKTFQFFPELINQLDQDGNDPLLYISLKVSGCRHRIVQLLIKMGADLQRRNSDGHNFIDTLRLPKNRNLLKSLLEHEIIDIEE